VSGLLPATWGDSDGLRVAEDVLAIGNAFGLNWTVTRGIVSSLHREVATDPRRIRRTSMISPYTDYIQTDAAINPGNSGGPIVNGRAEVVGISTAILSNTSDGIGFAIPSNDARFVANELIARGFVRRGYLGLQGVDLSTYPNVERRRIAPNSIARMIVSRVEEDTPASRAGLRPDDVVLALDGRLIESFQGLRNIIARTPPGTEVRLTIVRDGEEQEIKVLVGEFPGG
jgi:S1-C subfamily serine protease